MIQKTLIRISFGLLVALTSGASFGKNAAPVVSLTSPSNGDSFVLPASVVLTATASDSDGTIKQVDFYNGTTLIASKTSAPYSVTWSVTAAGTYSLSAKATDNLGASATSAVATVTVGAPKIGITSPSKGAAIYGDSVSVSGTFVGDATTTVLVDNGNSTRLATLSGNTFQTTLPVFIGPNTINIAVTRRDRTTDKASVDITGNAMPSIAWTSPTGSQFDAPATITAAVDAASPAGSISNVVFQKNGVVITTLAAPPYQTTLSNLGAGDYTLAATANDQNGQPVSIWRSIHVSGPNVPPSVAMTSPVDGSTLTAPATISLRANASDSDGSISTVEFLQNGVLVSSTNIAPYTASVNGLNVGNYVFAARATDNRGGVTTSAGVSVSVGAPNSPPTVALSSPQPGATFIEPASLTLTASAADSDGTVTKVEFYQGATLLGTALAPNFSFNWSGVAAGNYQLIAKAFDNRGASTISTPVQVTVVPNAAPTVALTSPATGTNLIAPASLTLAASASDSDGTVAKVEFYQGTTLLGTAVAPDFRYDWSGVGPGSYQLFAKAFDNRGASTTSAPVQVNVVPNSAPAVTLTSSSNGAGLFAPASVELTATASDNDGTIAKVAFYDGNAEIGTVTTAPYKLAWTNIAVGTHSVYAVAFDDRGATTQSQSVVIVINAPGIAVTAPMDGAVVQGEKLLVSGTVSAPVNSGVSVNGVVAQVTDDNRFYALIPTVAGNNPIKVTLTTPSGESSTRNLAVSSDGAGSPLAISMTATEGIAPLTTIFTLKNTGDVASSVTIGSYSPFTIEPGTETQYRVTRQTPGVFVLNFNSTQGTSQTSQQFVMVAHGGDVMDQKFKAIWSGMHEAVAAGKKDVALAALSEAARAKYGPVFDVLKDDYAQLMTSFSVPSATSIDSDVAEYMVSRVINGEKRIFLIYFVRDFDGVWRVDSM